MRGVLGSRFAVGCGEVGAAGRDLFLFFLCVEACKA